MDDKDILDIVRESIIWAKAEVVVLTSSQVTAQTVLSEPPVCLDSLEFIAMITRLEDRLGLVADDDLFFTRPINTVHDVAVVTADWLSQARTGRA